MPAILKGYVDRVFSYGFACEMRGETMEGNLDPAQLEGMNKDALLALAKDMGVDLPRGATKALIIERLAAVPVQVPASEDNGGAQ